MVEIDVTAARDMMRRHEMSIRLGRGGPEPDDEELAYFLQTVAMCLQPGVSVLEILASGFGRKLRIEVAKESEWRDLKPHVVLERLAKHSIAGEVGRKK